MLSLFIHIKRSFLSNSNYQRKQLAYFF